MKNFECILSSFEEIYPIWHDKLWQGRISKIEPMSSLCWQLPNKIVKDSSIFKSFCPNPCLISHNFPLYDGDDETSTVGTCCGSSFSRV